MLPVKGKIRILQVLPSLDSDFGGPVTSAYAVARAYERIGAVTTISTGAPQGLWRNVSVLTFPHFSIPGLPKYVGQVSPSLLRHIRRHADDYDLIHIHMNRGLVTLPAALLARRMPYIVQTHGMCAPWAGWKTVVDRALTKPVLSNARAVLCLNGLEQQTLASLNERTFTLPNAIVGESQPPHYRSREGPLGLLFCARLHPRKGLDVFLRTADALRLRGHSVDTVVVGPDEGARASAERLAASLALPVRFTGPLGVDGVRNEMANAQFLVHPAPFEPFGMSMIEALSRGLPVIASPTSLLAPVFKEYEAVALPLTEKHPAYCSAIEALLSDPDQMDRQVENGQRLVRDRFSLDSLSKNLEAILKVIL